MLSLYYAVRFNCNLVKLLLNLSVCDIQNLKLEDKPALQDSGTAGKTELVSNSENTEVVSSGLLTLGTSWVIGLSQRDSSGSDLVTAACDLWGSSNSYPPLLYRYCSLFFIICNVLEALFVLQSMSSPWLVIYDTRSDAPGSFCLVLGTARRTCRPAPFKAFCCFLEIRSILF